MVDDFKKEKQTEFRKNLVIFRRKEEGWCPLMRQQERLEKAEARVDKRISSPQGLF